MTKKKESQVEYMQATLAIPEPASAYLEELVDLENQLIEAEREAGDTTRIEEEIWAIEARLSA